MVKKTEEVIEEIIEEILSESDDENNDEEIEINEEIKDNIINKIKDKKNPKCRGECGLEKDPSEFVTDVNAKRGYRLICKPCHAINVKKRNNPRKTTGTKFCYGHQENHPVADFASDKSKSDGLQGDCKAYKAKIRKERKEKLAKINKKVEKKYCPGCDKYKTYAEFHVNISATDGLHKTCGECRSKERKQLDYKKPTEGTKYCPGCKKTEDVSKFYADKSSTDGMQTNCKNCHRKTMQKWASTFHGFLTKLFNDLVQNAKRRSKKIKVDITIDDIIELYGLQEGKCALTNKKMTHIAYANKKGEHIMNKYNISVDRIDSSKDYTQDNIQLVCAIANRMKTDLAQNDFIELCKSIVDCNK
jgi:hypothetical protein